MLGGEQGGGIFDQLKEAASQFGLEKLQENFPQIGEMLEGMDSSSIQDIITHFQENGLPKDLSSITDIINQFKK